MIPRISMRAVGGAVAFVSAFALVAVANSTASAQPWCGTDSLSLSTGALTTTEYVGQDQFDLILTNISQESCALQGYPGVDLVGPDVPTWGPVFSLRRTSADPQSFTLAPGASAASVITVGAPSLPEDFWMPTTIVVTPPDATTQLQVPWISGDVGVLRQDGATRPASFVGPLEPSH